MGDFDSDKQRLLDLLVDGELSDDERRELLAWCERETDGWRRCALAFLEAQSWSKVLGDLTDTSRPVGCAPTAAVVTRRDSFWNVRQWGTMLAMAASVVLAFTLGLWIRDSEQGRQIAPLAQPSTSVVGRGGNTVEANQANGDWSQLQPSAVPDEVRRAFERLGHEVAQERRYVPYRLNDGRRVVVPVDDVEVRPLENRSYQ